MTCFSSSSIRGLCRFVELLMVLHADLKCIQSQGLVFDLIAKFKDINMSSVLFLMQGSHGIQEI